MARAAVAAGATLLNDVGGANGAVAAELGVAWAAMHVQGEPATMQDDPRYDDVVAEVLADLVGRADAAIAAGVPEVWIDPGIGFGKTHAHNLTLLAHLDAFVATGYPVLVGTSRKGFLGRLLADSDGTDAPGRPRRPPRGLAWPPPPGRWPTALAWCACTTSAPPRTPPSSSAARSRRKQHEETMVVAVKGKWAQGIQPRNFAWILKDRLAVCERPGGYGANHRRVRRQEEIIWIREQGFTCVVTLIPSPHNLHNYDELGVPWRHVPFGPHEEPITVLQTVFPELADMLAAPGGKVLVHQDELSDRVAGLMAGFLLWSEAVPLAPQATSVVERLLSRQMGPLGRDLVALAATVPK